MKYKNLHTIGINFTELNRGFYTASEEEELMINNAKNLLLLPNNIRCLKLQQCSDINLSTLRVNRLELLFCHEVVIPTCIQSLKTDNYHNLFQDRFPNLTTLELYDMEITNDQLKLLKNFPMLNQLSLTYCYEITNVQDLKTCENLENLRIETRDHVDIYTFRHSYPTISGINECSQIKFLYIDPRDIECNFGLSNLCSLKYLFLECHCDKVKECKLFRNIDYVIFVDVCQTLDEISDFYNIPKKSLLLIDNSACKFVIWTQRTLFNESIIMKIWKKYYEVHKFFL
jgi:hypothetical protein